jgi:putative transposase
MIDRSSPLAVRRQCQLLSMARSSAYHRSAGPSQEDLALMRRIDALHLEHPFLGTRRLSVMLARDGPSAGRVHIGTLMRRMGIEAVYRKRRTSVADKGHEVYPYLLRDVLIERPNQVWATDITYIPMAQGSAYLVAIVDLYSRRVLAHRVSNCMSTDFCIEALQEALRRYGAPEIFNSDQGSQFTAEEFTRVLLAKGVRVSMDGKGRWIDNVFVERLWRSVKYEHVYLHAHESLHELRAGLRKYFRFYNEVRPHQSLEDQTPDTLYFGADSLRRAA